VSVRARVAAIVLGMVAASSLQPPRVHAQQVAYAASVGPELDSATQVAVAREIGRARERGIPVEPLVAKVREGRLKRAPGPRIRSAVEKLAERLDQARSALGGESTVEEIVAGADAIAAGAPPVALTTLRKGTNLRPIAVPLGTLAQLVASGVPATKAVEMITALLRRNAAPAQVLALGNQVEADVASGLRGEESAAFRVRGIEALLPSFGDKVTVASPSSGNVGPPPPSSKGTPVRRP
jgi:hypothetical protein